MPLYRVSSVEVFISDQNQLREQRSIWEGRGEGAGENPKLQSGMGMKECVCVGGESVITGTHKTIRIAFAVSYGKGERMIISHAICFSMIQKAHAKEAAWRPVVLWEGFESLPCHIPGPWKDQDLFYLILLAPLNVFVVDGNVFKAKVLAVFPALLWIYMESKLRKKAFITK